MTRKILLPFLMSLMAVFAFGQSTHTIAPGDFSNPAIWSSGVPDRTTNAVVRHAVIIDAQSSVLRLNVVSPSGSITNTEKTLHVWGDLTVSTPSGWIESGSAKTEIRGKNSTISGKITFNRLRINKTRKGGPYTAVAEDTLFVEKYFYLFRGNLDATSSAVVLKADGVVEGNMGYSPDGDMTGDLVWQKYVDRCNEWSTYSAPFDVSLASIASNTGGRMIYAGWADADFPTLSGGFINTYFYDEASGYVAPTSIGNTLAGGKGYWYWNSDIVQLSEGESIPQQWTWELIGNGFNSGRYNFDVTFDNDGMNLIGNPYPGLLDWNHGSWNSTNIDDALYYWNTCTQSYASYVAGVGSNGGDRYIPAGQGFWVEATGGSPAISTSTKALSLGTVNAKPLKNNEDELISAIILTLNGDETKLLFDENSSLEFNSGFDAKKIIAPAFVNDLSAIKTVYNGVNFSVNTIPFENSIIPLDIKGEGELTFTGANLFEEVNIFLEDKLLGDVIDMKLQQSYTFENGEKNFTDRFNIIIEKKTPLAQSQIENSGLSFYPNPVGDKLNITSINTFDKVEVYNTLGKLVLSNTSNSNIMSIDMTTLNSGVYIVKVFNDSKEIGVMMTQKL